MELKILSWNIWVDGHFDKIKEFLSATNADIIGLQEVLENDPERDVISFLTDQGYQHVFAMTEHAWGGKNYKIGPALFTKLPITDSGVFFINDEDKRAVAWMDIQVNGEPISFFSVHLVHAHQKKSEKKEFEVAHIIEKLPSNRAIVLGDFNATPESNVIQTMRQTLRDTDTNDLPTWSVYKEGCGVCQLDEVNTKLDYIFTSNDLKAHSFTVHNSDASDHLPISVIVNI